MLKTSNDIDQLMNTVGEMQSEGVTISKNKASNRSRYADLPQILEWIQKRCAKYGLVLTQDETIYEGKPALVSLLFHKASKQWKMGISLLTPNESNGNSDQAWAASTTYHRRYGAMMSLGIFQEDDPSDNDSQTSSSSNTNSTESAKENITKNFGSSRKTGTITDKQYEYMSKLLKNAPDDMQLTIMEDYEISNLKDLPFDKAQEVFDRIKSVTRRDN